MVYMYNVYKVNFVMLVVFFCFFCGALVLEFKNRSFIGLGSTFFLLHTLLLVGYG